MLEIVGLLSPTLKGEFDDGQHVGDFRLVEFLPEAWCVEDPYPAELRLAITNTRVLYDAEREETLTLQDRARRYREP